MALLSIQLDSDTCFCFYCTFYVIPVTIINMVSPGHLQKIRVANIICYVMMLLYDYFPANCFVINFYKREGSCITSLKS